MMGKVQFTLSFRTWGALDLALGGGYYNHTRNQVKGVASVYAILADELTDFGRH